MNIDCLDIGRFRTECRELPIFSGGKTSGQTGGRFILSKKMERALIAYNPTSDSIITISIQSRPVNYAFIQVHALTSTCDEKDITLFYSQLQQTIDRTKIKDVVSSSWEILMKKFGGGEVTQRKETLETLA